MKLSGSRLPHLPLEPSLALGASRNKTTLELVPTTRRSSITQNQHICIVSGCQWFTCRRWCNGCCQFPFRLLECAQSNQDQRHSYTCLGQAGFGASPANLQGLLYSWPGTWAFLDSKARHVRSVGWLSEPTAGGHMLAENLTFDPAT